MSLPNWIKDKYPHPYGSELVNALEIAWEALAKITALGYGAGTISRKAQDKIECINSSEAPTNCWCGATHEDQAPVLEKQS